MKQSTWRSNKWRWRYFDVGRSSKHCSELAVLEATLTRLADVNTTGLQHYSTPLFI